VSQQYRLPRCKEVRVMAPPSPFYYPFEPVRLHHILMVRFESGKDDYSLVITYLFMLYFRTLEAGVA
jgi:hypothetical protein